MMSSIDDLWPFQRLGLLVSLNITVSKKQNKTKQTVKSVARNLEVSICVFLFFGG